MWRLMAVLALTAIAAAAQDAAGAIEGAVTDSATTQPVAGVQISIAPPGTAADIVTDPSGGFRFESLAPGKYGLSLKLAGYREAFRFVVVKDAASTTQVALKLTPFSEIAGQVLDEDGHPVQGAVIYIGLDQRATTGADGRYRIAELVPGEYLLYCRPTPAWRESVLQHDPKTGEAMGYADTYYFPGVDDRDRGVKTAVSAGVHLGGFDFRLRRTALAEFSGRLLDRDSGDPLTTAALELQPAKSGASLLDESRERRRVDRKAAFQFKLIPPGRYNLLVYRNGGVDMSAQPFRIAVDLDAAGLAGAELRVPKNVNLPVNITAPHPERARGSVAVLVGRNFGDVLPHSSLITMCEVGSPCFVHDIPPGEWKVNVQALSASETGDPPHPLAIDSVRLGRQNAWGAPVTVAEGGNPPIEIVLTDQTGSISAAVSTDDGQPVETALILARRVDIDPAPTSGPAGIMYSKGGRFLLEERVPGDYEVAAFVEDEDIFRAASPSLCGDRAAKVTVTANQTASVTLHPCTPPMPQ